MAFELKAKREQYAKVVKELQAVAQNVKAEERAFTSEEKEKVSRMQSEEAALRGEIDTLESLAGVEKLADVEAVVRSSTPAPSNAPRLPSAKDFDLAFRSWLSFKTGNASELSDQHYDAVKRCGINLHDRAFSCRAQTVGTDAQGGHLVKDQELASVVNVLKAFGGVRSVATVIPRKQNIEIKHPLINDTANLAGRMSELGGVTNTNLVVGEVKISASNYTSGVFPISAELIRDSDYPIQKMVATYLGQRLARAQNKDATDHATFRGLLQDAPVGTAEFTLAAIEYADLVAIQKEINRAYSPTWMFNSNVLSELQLMVGTDGHPIWRPDLVGGVPNLLMGKGYTINDDMDDDTILYGDFSYYHMVEVGSPELIVEENRIASNSYSVAIMQNFGGGIVNTTAIKQFARSAT